MPIIQGRLKIYGGCCILKKYAVLAVKPQPRFWLLPCGFIAVAVLFSSNVVNRGLQKMTPRRALKPVHRKGNLHIYTVSTISAFQNVICSRLVAFSKKASF
jgi:hypothetical protein